MSVRFENLTPPKKPQSGLRTWLHKKSPHRQVR